LTFACPDIQRLSGIAPVIALRSYCVSGETVVLSDAI
jgi:hypothetical protein